VRPSRRDRTTPALRSSRKRLAHPRLGHVDGRGQVADAQLAGLGQGEEDPHPAAVAEQPEHHGQALGLVEVEEVAAGVGHPGRIDHPDGAPVEGRDVRRPRLGPPDLRPPDLGAPASAVLTPPPSVTEV